VIRLGLLGCGKWGANYLKAADGFGVATVSRGGDLAGFDAVCIATPPDVSVGLAVAALSEGLPVMIEKPAGLSTDDANRLASAEARSKAFVLVNHQHLFAPEFDSVRGISTADTVLAEFTGPVTRDCSPLWDYGAHAAACILALGARNYTIVAGLGERCARVESWAAKGTRPFVYDGYATMEPPLTTSLRAFATAVRNGGTDDYRFGSKWAIDVARLLERIDPRLDAK
jgi:predicted dehydrogenase